jgi:hypothetical protein
MPTVTFTSGTGSWTVPAGVTSLDVAAWGGGGGGGLTAEDDLGGGGGAYAGSTIPVTPGQTVWYSVGGPAAGSGSPLTPGANGSSSWVNKASNTTPGTSTDGVLAVGGGGANIGSSGTPGIGGAATSCVGSTRYSGGAGGTNTGRGGGGAGSGGNASGGTGGTPDGGNGEDFFGSTAAQAPGGGSYTSTMSARGEVRITYTAAVTRRPIRLVALR